MTDRERMLEQAKTLLETVKLLKSRVLARHAQAARDGMCPDLTLPQMNLLGVVQRCEPVSIKELAQRLHVSAPSASTMVDRLVDMGMLVRRQSEVDRREVAIELSPEGRARHDEFEEHILQAIVELLDRAGPELAAKWSEVYGRLGNVLYEMQDDPVHPAPN